MDYTHAIDSLKGVLVTLGTSIGAVMLVYGGIKFAMAFRQMEQQGAAVFNGCGQVLHHPICCSASVGNPWLHHRVFRWYHIKPWNRYDS